MLFSTTIIRWARPCGRSAWSSTSTPVRLRPDRVPDSVPRPPGKAPLRWHAATTERGVVLDEMRFRRESVARVRPRAADATPWHASSSSLLRVPANIGSWWATWMWKTSRRWSRSTSGRWRWTSLPPRHRLWSRPAAGCHLHRHDDLGTVEAHDHGSPHQGHDPQPPYYRGELVDPPSFIAFTYNRYYGTNWQGDNLGLHRLPVTAREHGFTRGDLGAYRRSSCGSSSTKHPQRRTTSGPGSTRTAPTDTVASSRGPPRS